MRKKLYKQKRKKHNNNSKTNSKTNRILHINNKTIKHINKKTKILKTLKKQKGGSVNHIILKYINPFQNDIFAENHLNLFYGISFLDSNIVHNYNVNFINDKVADTELSNLGKVWKKLFHKNDINEITIKSDIIKQIRPQGAQNTDEETKTIIKKFSTIITLYE
jgi:hypothetical protein